MKNFISRVVLFVLFFGTFSILLHHMFFQQHPYWGNTMYEGKVQQFKHTGKPYNLAVFGSSRMAVGLEPAVFDSCLATTVDKKIKTYNFSSFGTWNQENEYLFKKFLEDRSLSGNIRYVLMEYQNVMSIGWERIATDKVVYYQTLENLRFAWDYSHASLSSYKWLGYVPVFLLAYAENQFNLGSSDIFIKAKEISHAFNSYGYTDIRTEHQQAAVIDPFQYAKSYKKYGKAGLKKLNSSYFTQVNQLQAMAAEKGIQLIWVLPPVTVTEEMMAVFNAIPTTHKLNFNDADLYPVLFQKENWYDKTHFNEKGARLFSQLVAAEFSKRLQE